MQPRFESLHEKNLIGMHMEMSLSNDLTFKLWQTFMKRQSEIKNRFDSIRFSLQWYPKNYFADFNPDNKFEKWAAVEVNSVDEIPYDMEKLILPAGKYAVFIHIGAAKTGPKMFQYIFQQWLPQSDYDLDNRPHFEILGEKYKNGQPDSEEEIWIPIRAKAKN